ncbi:TCR/Tet family MFS transporter [Halovulum dunhuangense]|uniref:TCR/Tet family MFS transporter n=1 Tax=Halovulum dunhuangense TaxID=1505036 RepID=A0A849L549_9RHOB|nr:TCR/Tet family MFS transporter [Halovulum dunhuangense]NNU81310.1 TCR/Tet family MFS transporter [Halovulum dunhuangense]
MTSRAPFVFIILTVAIDAIGIGLILPVMPELIRELRGASISDAAFWGGWLAFTYAVMQFLCGPLLGGLSDRFGRRPVLILSLVLLGIDYLLMAVAPALWMLFLARFLAGAAGATHATAAAYLADISDKGKRSANFGLIGAAFGIGFTLGPAIGGLLGELGPRAPFYAAAALALGNAAFGWRVLPESLPPERRARFELARANPFRALLDASRLPMVGGLLLVHFLYVVSNYVYPAIWSFFTIERFGWSTGMVGLSLAAFGVSSAFVQGWLIRRLLPRLGEFRTAMFGLAMHVLALVILAVIEDGIWIFVFMPITALGVVVGPALQGMMADRVPDDAQGRLQGVLASVAAVAVILSPVVMTGIFRLATLPDGPVYLPGAPFLAAAALAAVCALLLMRGRKAAA